MNAERGSSLLTLALVGLACGSEAPTAPVDAGAPESDASVLDANAGGEDAAPMDAGLPDASGLDAGDSDAGAPGADAGEPDSGPPPVTFTGDVYPMFEGFGCTTGACHGSFVSPGGFALLLSDPFTAYADSVNRESIREPRLIVEPGNAEDSVMFIHGRDENIPMGDLDAAGLELMRTWIDEGAAFGEDVDIPPDPVPDTCTVAGTDGFTPLPPACTPRCSAETWNAAAACTTAACQTAALDADTTPSVTLDVVTDVLTVDCGVCVDWQVQSCLADHCPAELFAVQRCRAAGGTCDPEIGDIQQCAASSTEFDACRIQRLPACAPTP